MFWKLFIVLYWIPAYENNSNRSHISQSLILSGRIFHSFAVITGPNGVGKSQLLKLIYTKLSGNSRDPRVQEEKGKIDIQGIENIHPNQVQYIDEWKMTKVNGTSLGQLQQDVKQLYENFRSSLRGNEYRHNPLYLKICSLNNIKNPNDISLEEFKKSYFQLHVPEPKSLAQHIEKLFTDYWIDKVELTIRRI